MPIVWADLSRTERRAIVRLLREDSGIGVHLETIERGLYPAILMLHDKGLVTSRLGWCRSVWVTLTENGRHLPRDANRRTKDGNFLPSPLIFFRRSGSPLRRF